MSARKRTDARGCRAHSGRRRRGSLAFTGRLVAEDKHPACNEMNLLPAFTARSALHRPKAVRCAPGPTHLELPPEPVSTRRAARGFPVAFPILGRDLLRLR